jgi:heme-degrading monooxygenase HmoA
MPLAPRCADLPPRLCEDWAMILVVFRSRNRPDGDVEEYQRRSRRMHELVQQHPGFISIESFETPDGEEVSLELFENDESVKAWRDNPEHRDTQRWAREEFYSWYSTQVSEVIRAHEVDLMQRNTAKAAS